MHKFCTAGCRSTVGKSDAHSRDGSKQVLVPSTAIFHLILQICFWGTPECLCQSPWRTRGWRAMGHFYHLTCPLSLTKTHRVDFAKSATEFVIFFSRQFPRSSALSKAYPSRNAYRTGLVCSAPLSKEQRIAPAAALQQRTLTQHCHSQWVSCFYLDRVFWSDPVFLKIINPEEAGK